MNEPKVRKQRLCIDFVKPEHLAEFVSRLKESGVIPPKAGAYRVESLDFMARVGGVGRKNTFILLDEDEAGEGRERFIYYKAETI